MQASQCMLIPQNELEKAVALGPERTELGRRNLQITDRRISRIHACIEVGDDGSAKLVCDRRPVYVQPKEGPQVELKEKHEYPLSEGDVVSFLPDEYKYTFVRFGTGSQAPPKISFKELWEQYSQLRRDLAAAQNECRDLQAKLHAGASVACNTEGSVEGSTCHTALKGPSPGEDDDDDATQCESVSQGSPKALDKAEGDAPTPNTIVAQAVGQLLQNSALVLPVRSQPPGSLASGLHSRDNCSPREDVLSAKNQRRSRKEMQDHTSEPPTPQPPHWDGSIESQMVLWDHLPSQQWT